MKNGSGDEACRISRTVYERLLVAYPRSHRYEYGAAMAQLFRDQCRDAWTDAQTWGLIKLWLRVLPDLAGTAVMERLAALRERKTMTDKLANLMAFRSTPGAVFLKVFVLVFLLVFLVSAAITFILPETYASIARLQVNSEETAAGQSPVYDPYFIQTTIEVMESPQLLNPVAEQLKLGAKWGKKYYNGLELKTPLTVELLKARLQIAPIRNTGLISVTAFSDDKNEAAQIANAVADSYIKYRAQSSKDLAVGAVKALDDEYQAQEAEVRMARTSLDALQRKFDIPDNVDGAGTMLAEAEKTFQEKNSQLAFLRSLEPKQKREILPSIVADAGLSDLLGKLRNAEQQYVTLTNDYALDNPVVGRVTSLIGVLNRQIDDRVDGIMAGLESRLAAAKAASDRITAQIQRSKPSPETQSYWDAKERLDRLTEAHKLLFAKMENQDFEARLPKPPSVEIVDSAEPGYAPVRPNKTLNLTVGAVAGIVLGCGAGAVFALWSATTGRRKPNPAAS
jgi:uncharacterized protein involved in exopolysaccharide biosynthesis